MRTPVYHMRLLSSRPKRISSFVPGNRFSWPIEPVRLGPKQEMDRKQKIDRRRFIEFATLGAAGALANKVIASSDKPDEALPKLSLSQWALHRAHFGASKDNYQRWQRLLRESPDEVLEGWLKPLDFPKVARERFGFEAVEYVNTFIFGKARDDSFLEQLRTRCDDYGVKSVLLMVDEAGYLGHSDTNQRHQSIQNHLPWIEASAKIGCDAVRVNAHGIGSYEEQKEAAAESLRTLVEHAEPFDVKVLVENHGGLSSFPPWLLETLKSADHPLLGTMVDFDNFAWSEERIWHSDTRYDRYKGVEELMPLAQAVSAKSHNFDADGSETTIDYHRMADIIKTSGYNGYIGVEHEGNHFSEEEGIEKTRDLLIKAWQA